MIDQQFLVQPQHNSFKTQWQATALLLFCPTALGSVAPIADNLMATATIRSSIEVICFVENGYN